MRWTQSLLTSYCLLVTSWVSGERLGTPIKNNPAASVTSAPPVIDPNKPASSRKFLFHSQLDENYDLFWDFNDTHITFETLVKTNGYIGFGISDSGSMFPSDVIIGWVKDGHNHFSDRHANGHFMPPKDTVQHWLLLGGMEQGQYTRLTFVRPLDSCDSQDKPIKEGTTRVIFSYHPSDPASDDQISYHGAQTRGSKSLLLLDPPSEDKKQTQLPSDITTYDFLNYGYKVPATDTTYRCTIWKMPDLGAKHHMIRYEPVIQKGHEKLLHHIILYYCEGSLPDSRVGYDFACYHHTPRDLHGCEHVFVAWAIGGQAFDYPLIAGQSMGTAGDPGYFKMETHYDNPDMRADFVDNSGIRIFLTQQLRTHDAGVLEVGVNVDPYQIVPPNNPSFLSTGHCHPNCLSEGLGGQEIRVFSNLLHAHLIGVKLRTRHFRNGVELQPIGEDNNYDFNFQEQRYLPQERVVKAGDYLVTECVYDSRGRAGLTLGGLSSREEMCLSFLVYYPKVSLSICRSRLQYELLEQYSGHDAIHFLSKLDWSKQSVQESFQKDVEEAKITNICRDSGKHISFNLSVTDKPAITSYRNVTDTCKN